MSEFVLLVWPPLAPAPLRQESFRTKERERERERREPTVACLRDKRRRTHTRLLAANACVRGAWLCARCRLLPLSTPRPALRGAGGVYARTRAHAHRERAFTFVCQRFRARVCAPAPAVAEPLFERGDLHHHRARVHQTGAMASAAQFFCAVCNRSTFAHVFLGTEAD